MTRRALAKADWVNLVLRSMLLSQSTNNLVDAVGETASSTTGCKTAEQVTPSSMQVYNDDVALLPGSMQALDSSSSGCMTSATAPLPTMLDKVLLDPAAPSGNNDRPALAMVSQRIFSHTQHPAASSLCKDTMQPTNRPVKRSSVGLPVSASPKRQQEHTVASNPSHSGTSSLISMRSPPPLSKNPFKPAKRAFEASFATQADRPFKRVNNSSNSMTSEHSGTSVGIPEQSATSLERCIPLKAKRSSVPSISSAFASACAGAESGTGSVGPQLFDPPAHIERDRNQSSDSSSLKIERANASHATSTIARNPASLLSLSPSKFEISLPQRSAFSKPSSSTSRSTLCFLSAASEHDASKLGGLAPSPMRPDEHVPRPLAVPVHILPSRSSSSELPNSLNASPNRVQAAFGNPFLMTQQGRAQISAALQVPSSPPLSPERRSPGKYSVTSDSLSTSSSGSSTLPSRPASPMQRDDLMRRTIENKHVLQEQERSPVLVASGSKQVRHLYPTDRHTERQKSPSVAASQPQDNSVKKPLLYTSHEVPNHGADSCPPLLQLPCSPLKRPFSPTKAEGSMDSEERQVRQRSEDTLSRSKHGLLRRQSARQATRGAVVGRKESISALESASSLRKPHTSVKSRQTDVGPEQSILQYRPASAGGSAPITRPPPSRSLSDPSTSIQALGTSSTDVFMAPTLASSAPAQSRPIRDSPVEEGDSGETFDADTSVMSTSGLSSLANLQSLLSRMSRPSLSRRSSAAFPYTSTSLSRLPEATEVDTKPIGANNAGTSGSVSSQRPIAPLPRYAAPTSSSAARQSKGSKGQDIAPDVSSLDSSVPKAKDARRRISHGVPEARRGSLLPVAVNAAQRLTVRPDSATSMHGVQRVPAVEVTTVEKCTILKDVVAFVDVKTAEGDEAGGVFVDILRGLGARVGISSESFGLQG